MPNSFICNNNDNRVIIKSLSERKPNLMLQPSSSYGHCIFQLANSMQLALTKKLKKANIEKATNPSKS